MELYFLCPIVTHVKMKWLLSYNFLSKIRFYPHFIKINYPLI